MPLFEQQINIGAMLDVPNGFRLKRLEVYNWGTFDSSIWVFTPDMETSLLTGDVGSGKSTLVDALLTLLIPPRRIRYNRAADSSAKERTLTSYVRGYYGQKRGEEGSGRHEALRGTGTYSVLLAAFCDQSLDKTVTLAQFYWYNDTSKPVSRLYAVGTGDFNIAEHFSGFTGDTRAFKKQLRDKEYLQIFDDYARYNAAFTKLLGISSAQALDLFQQTVAMKKVDELTSFVRENMLEDPQIREDIDILITRFEDLNSAHSAVVRAKKQIELLAPIAQDSNRHSKFDTERTAYTLSREWLPTWFANTKIELLETSLSKLQTKLTSATLREQQVLKEISNCNQELDRIRDQIRQNGGSALEEIRAQIEGLGRDLERITAKRRDYDLLCKNLELKIPTDLVGFAATKEQIVELKANEQVRHNRLSEQRQDVAVELADVRNEINTIRDELDSLRGRQSSIPRQQMHIRSKLTEALGLTEDSLPFVGELLEVRQNEIAWEGAIERLLHNFALSLLVPAKHYGKVMEWVDKTSLNARLVYYRVPDDPDKLGRTADAVTVAGKLTIKPESDCYSWLANELGTRFNHVCANSSEQFRREKNAVTILGQIKTGGKRHEKDDRHSLTDQTRYVLGFSNQRKVDALDTSLAKLTDRENNTVKQEKKLCSAQADAQSRRDSLTTLQAIGDFAEIDTNTTTQNLLKLQTRKSALESGNAVLNELMQMRESMEHEREALESRHRDAGKDLRHIEVDIENQKLERAELYKHIAEAIPDDQAQKDYVAHGTLLQFNAEQALNGAKITLGATSDLERRYNKWLNEKIAALDKRLERLRDKIIKQMNNFKHAFPEDTQELDDSLESASEYEERLTALKEDDLPRFELRFKDMLNTDVINNISLFSSKLTTAQGVIRNRITAINSELYQIDYNDGRFIRLEIEPTLDSEIKDFQVQLKACTEGALAGAGNNDEHYAESKFLQVRAILERFMERPNEPERDRIWTRKVTDVRNWYMFAASERWRETNEEYEHYTDSGGKSGGQKEKLAYLILAASLVYNYGVNSETDYAHGFRFVIIDEAFLKSSDDAARFGLELFKKLDLQLLIVTPLLKVHTIAPYISHVGFVSHDDIAHRSALRNISIDEFERQRRLRRTNNASMD